MGKEMYGDERTALRQLVSGKDTVVVEGVPYIAPPDLRALTLRGLV